MFSKKFTTFIVLIGIFTGTFFFNTSTVNAQFAVTDPGLTAITAAENTRKTIIDVANKVAVQLANIAVQKVVSSTIEWANSGFDGNPAYITDPKQYFTDIADGVAGEYIQGTDLGFLCSPFQANIRLSLAQQYYKPRQFQCTLTGITGNIEDFYTDFSSGGWDSWFSMTQNPTNNPYGAYIEAKIELDSRLASAVGLEKTQFDLNQGFKNVTECLETDPDTGKCTKEGPVKTPGSVIKSQLDRVLPSGLEKLIGVQTAEQLIVAFAQGLLQRYVFGDKGLFSGDSKYDYPGSTTVPDPTISALLTYTSYGSTIVVTANVVGIRDGESVEIFVDGESKATCTYNPCNYSATYPDGEYTYSAKYHSASGDIDMGESTFVSPSTTTGSPINPGTPSTPTGTNPNPGGTSPGAGNKFFNKFTILFSYFDAMDASNLSGDLDYLKSKGIDGIRIFPNWWDYQGPGNFVFSDSALMSSNGNIKNDRLSRLEQILDAASSRGMLVDITFTRDTVDGPCNQAGNSIMCEEEYKKGVTSVANTIKGRNKIIIDLQNEAEGNNPITKLDPTHIKNLADRVRATGITSPLSVSYGTSVSEGLSAANEFGLDINNFHLANTSNFNTYINNISGAGASSKEVYLGEPYNTSFIDREGATATDIINRAKEAKKAGVSVWTFHTSAGFQLDNSSLESRLSAVEKEALNNLSSSLASVTWGRSSSGGTTPTGDAPNKKDVADQISSTSSNWADCEAGVDPNNGVPSCHLFVREVARKLNETDSRWGLITKNPGEQQCYSLRCAPDVQGGYGEDILAWLPTGSPVSEWIGFDIVQGAGEPGARVVWDKVGSRRAGNNWAPVP